MKKVFFALLLLVSTLTVSANEIRYFTNAQAYRTVDYLNRQNELMIYCGYEYEIPTYVILSDVWAESINPQYNEIWIFGYDAYTGEEIYMPIDLGCIWIYNHGHIISAAQILRFRSSYSLPHNYVWVMPTYHHFTRVPHCHTYVRTYHYDVHVYGWNPHHHHHDHYYDHYHVYYLRDPHVPAPMPAPYTPGVEQPAVHRGSNNGSSTGYSYIGTTSRTSTPASNVTTTTTRNGANPSGQVSTEHRSTNSASTSTPTRRGNSEGTSENNNSRGTNNNSSTSTSRSGNTTSTSAGTSSRGTNNASTSTTSSRSGNTTSASSSSSSRSTASEGSSSQSSRNTSTSTSSNTSSRKATTSTSTNTSSRSASTSTSSSSRTSTRSASSNNEETSSSRSSAKDNTSSSRSTRTSNTRTSR